jgi:hypothetical protein
MEVSDYIYAPAVSTRGTAPGIRGMGGRLGTRTVSGVDSYYGEMNPVFQKKTVTILGHPRL